MQGNRSETYTHGPNNNKLNQVGILDNGSRSTRVLRRDARGALTLDTHLFSPLSWCGVDMQYARYSALANVPAYEALDVV